MSWYSANLRILNKYFILYKHFVVTFDEESTFYVIN